MAHFHGAVTAKHVHGDGSFGTGAPVITGITSGETSINVAWTGTATHYRINGGTATALPDGTSPDTITGLTANTEYDAPGLELGASSSGPWSDPVAFGTTNPGSGGGGIPTYADITAAAGVATASTLTGKATFRAAVTAAAGAATASALAGKSTARAAATPAAGTATTGTLASDGSRASITPAAGTSTTGSLAGKSTARASIVPAAGASTTRTLVPVGAAPPAAPTLEGSGGADTRSRRRPSAADLAEQEEEAFKEVMDHLKRPQQAEAEEAEVLDIIMALAAAGVLD